MSTSLDGFTEEFNKLMEYDFFIIHVLKLPISFPPTQSSQDSMIGLSMAISPGHFFLL